MKSYVRTISSTIRHAYLIGLKSMPSSSNFARYATTNFDIKFNVLVNFLCVYPYITLRVMLCNVIKGMKTSF